MKKEILHTVWKYPHFLVVWTKYDTSEENFHLCFCARNKDIIK